MTLTERMYNAIKVQHIPKSRVTGLPVTHPVHLNSFGYVIQQVGEAIRFYDRINGLVATFTEKKLELSKELNYVVYPDFQKFLIQLGVGVYEKNTQTLKKQRVWVTSRYVSSQEDFVKLYHLKQANFFEGYKFKGIKGDTLIFKCKAMKLIRDRSSVKALTAWIEEMLSLANLELLISPNQSYNKFHDWLLNESLEDLSGISESAQKSLSINSYYSRDIPNLAEVLVTAYENRETAPTLASKLLYPAVSSGVFSASDPSFAKSLAQQLSINLGNCKYVPSNE